MKKDKLFDSKDGFWQNVSWGWWESDNMGAFSAYAYSYLKASFKLFDEFMKARGYSDTDAFPPIFMFRHFVELILKANIMYATKIANLKNQNVELSNLDNIKKEHNIEKLYKQLLQIYPDTKYALSKEAKEILINLSRVDEKSDAFRYPVDTSGNQFWKGITVNIGILYTKLRELGEQLDAFNTQLNAELDYLKELISI